MKIALVFPPPFDLTQPYLSLPMLSSFLQQHKHLVEQHDLNAAFYNYILERQTIAHCARLLERADAQSNEPLLAKLERHKALTLARHLSISESDVGEYFRNPDYFFDPNLYSRGLRLLSRLCDIVSAAHSPTMLTPSSFRMRYQTSALSELMKATDDSSENPFLLPFRTRFAPEVVSNNPEMVGLSVVYSDQLIAAFTLAKCIKTLSPNTPIVVGGDVLSKLVRHRPQGISRLFDAIDVIVVDDGRQPLLDICERIAQNRSLEGIDRAVTADSSVKIPVRPEPETNLEEFGVPDYKGTQRAKYFSPEPLYSLLIGKGCAWGNCTFCTESFTKSYTAKNIDYVVSEMSHLANTFGVKCINFADSDVAPPMLRSLAESILEKGLTINWSCRARLDPRINDELCALLHTAGCRKIFFGLESASQRILKLMRKGTNIKRVPDVLRACSKNGIAVHLFSFVGFPGETREDVNLTADFFVKHRGHISSFNIGAFDFREETDVFLEADQYGVASTLNRAVDGDYDDHPYVVSSGLNMAEAEELAPRVAADVFERIQAVSPSFYLFRSSSYVNKKGVPCWDCHNLAYVAAYSHTWYGPSSASSVLPTDTLTASYVYLGTAPQGNTVVYSPETGKILSLPSAGMEILERYRDPSIVDLPQYLPKSELVRRSRFLEIAVEQGLLVKGSAEPCH